MLFLIFVLYTGVFLQAFGYEYCGYLESCKIVTDCPNAVTSLRQRQQHNLKRCGWSGFYERVCCPQADLGRPHTKAFSERRSVQACDELSNQIPVEISRHILGGDDTYAGEFPHMAALGYQSEVNAGIDWAECGGSLISNRYVLTAAHCLARQDGKKLLGVRLGKIDLLGNSDARVAQDYEVEEVIVHPDYVIRDKRHDIGLVRLKRPVALSYNIQPACLYDKDDDPEDLLISGWGLTAPKGSASSILQKAELRPVDLKTCNRTYGTGVFPRIIRDTQICAISKDRKARDACEGDSGGPLQIKILRETNVYSIVGITSFGDECGGARNLPSVYTRVFNYLDWIEDIAWP